MAQLDGKSEPLLRYSLAALWIFTGFFSLQPQGFLLGQELIAPHWGQTVANLLTCLGAALDMVLGMWLISKWRLRACYRIQLAAVLTYTLLLSYIAPHYWLDPFGSLTKNLPILALLWALGQ